MSPYSSAKIVLSLDLRIAAAREIDFLEKVWNEKWLHHQQVLKIAVYRYETFWLPFLKTQTGKTDLDFVPPIDIHWVWHVHMLSPREYQNDCFRLFGRSFDHKLGSLEEIKVKQETTKIIWSEIYPTEVFDLPSNEKDVMQMFEKVSSNESEFSYKLVEAALRQKSFYYQVSLPHFKKWFFLNESLFRYKKFLHLKKIYRKEFLVPCYDIDLMWHTHQVHPSHYVRDCEKLLKMVLPHDDSVDDRSEGSTLSAAYMRTKELWSSTFGEDYEKAGAMVRGEDPTGKLSSVSDEEKTRLVDVQIDTFQMENVRIPSIGWHKNIEIRLKMKLLNISSRSKIFEQKLLSEDWLIGPDSKDFCVKSIENSTLVVKSDTRNAIQVDLMTKKNHFSCLLAKKITGTPYPGFPVYSSGSQHSQPKSYQLENLLDPTKSDDISVSLDLKLLETRFEPSMKPIIFGIERGSFYESVMPQNVESMWGPVPFPVEKLPEGTENICNAVCHK
jgi:hypothetical protein